MYPYFTRFQPEDDKRFWFYNSMHFPEPMPAFDTITAEVPYSAIGANTARVFVFPTTLGIEHRIVNGRVYITANPVTDPDEIARRAAVFGERAGYYYENWDTLYQGWKMRIKGLIDEITSITVPELPEFDDLARGHRVARRGAEPLRAGELPPVHRPVLGDVAPPHRVPDARLRRLRGVLPVLQAGVPRDQRPGGGPHGGRHRRDHVPARRRAASAGPAGGRGRGGRPVHRGLLAGRGAGRAGRTRRGRPALARRLRTRPRPLVQRVHRRRLLPPPPQLGRRPHGPVRRAPPVRGPGPRRHARRPAHRGAAGRTGPDRRRPTGTC